MSTGLVLPGQPEVAAETRPGLLTRSVVAAAPAAALRVQRLLAEDACCELPAAVGGPAPAQAPRVWGGQHVHHHGAGGERDRLPGGGGLWARAGTLGSPRPWGPGRLECVRKSPAAGVPTALSCRHSWGVRCGPGRGSAGQARGTARDSVGLYTLRVWPGSSHWTLPCPRMQGEPGPPKQMGPEGLVGLQGSPGTEA